MTALLQDVRYALRQLRKNPGFTAVAVVTLALGIGATTAIYSVLYATLLEPMPYPHPEQLVMLWAIAPNGERRVVPLNDFVEWKSGSSVFQDLNAIHSGYSRNLAGGDRPERVIVQANTPGLLSMQGSPFLLGRNFLPEEGIEGNDHVTILSYALWEGLGADSGIIGKQLRIEGEPHTVVGVLAPGPQDRVERAFGGRALMVPLCLTAPEHQYSMIMGRLKAGVSVAQAQAQMNVIAERLAKERPYRNKDWHISVELLHTDFLPVSTRVTLWLLLIAVGLVLLIACVNIANLLLSRSIGRRQEIAVRVSLGASRGRIMAQYITESLAVSFLGGVAGIALAGLLIRLLLALLPQNALPLEADVRISLPVLLFTLVLTIGAGILSGCAPALQSARLNPNDILKKTGSRPLGLSARGLHKALVVIEFGLALTLLAAAGLSIRSFWKVVHVDVGVRTDHILTFTVPVSDKQFATPEQMEIFYRQLLANIKGLPGVTNAQLSTGMPVEERPWWGKDQPFMLFGETAPIGPGQWRQAAVQSMTPEYFDTFGLQMVKGRRFTDQDSSTSAPVAIVNEEFAKLFSPDADPLGRWIVTRKFAPFSTAPHPFVKLQIVGVYKNVRNFGVHQESVPEFDLPFWQAPSSEARMAVRTAGQPEVLIRDIASTLRSIRPDLPLADVKTMDDVLQDVSARDRFLTLLYGSFGVLALALAAVGIYGVMAFMVAQRTHEIGLRMAVGAGRERVLGMVLREALLLAGAGLLLGLGGAYLAGAVLRRMLYGVGGMDLGVLLVVAATLLTAAVLAAYLPARRAAKVDPVVALRYE